MEQQLEFPASNASEPDQRLEPDHATGDALLQHRSARDAPRRIRAGRRAGRSGSGGVLSPANSGNWVLGAGPTFIFPTATSRFTGQGKVADGTHFRGRLPHKGSNFIGVFPQQWMSFGGQHGRARHEPDELCNPSRRSSSARAGASGTPAISWRTGTRRLRTSGRSPSGSAWARW